MPLSPRPQAKRRRDMIDTEQAESSSRGRFVVLRHTDRHGVHFDLMIDGGEMLATWKSAWQPESVGAEGRTWCRIADHRRAYLDYEGSVSGDRGSVVRHDEGICTVHSRHVDRWEITFEGGRLRGRYILARSAETDQSWSLRPLGQ